MEELPEGPKAARDAITAGSEPLRSSANPATALLPHLPAKLTGMAGEGTEQTDDRPFLEYRYLPSVYAGLP